MLEYQLFTLENLKDDIEFAKFIYLFSFDSLVGSKDEKPKTQKLAEDYITSQNEIEKKFYNEYKQIRIEIFENMKLNNPKISKNIIIEKVQK